MVFFEAGLSDKVVEMYLISLLGLGTVSVYGYDRILGVQAPYGYQPYRLRTVHLSCTEPDGTVTVHMTAVRRA